MTEVMAKVEVNVDQPSLPSSGHFIWKEDRDPKDDTIKKAFLEFVSNNPNADKQERRRRAARESNKKGDRVASSVAKNQSKKGGGVKLNQPKSPRPPIKQTETHNTVTLDDIKSVALEMMSDQEQMAENFDSIYHTQQFDDFLLHLLSYFNCFFEKLHSEHKLHVSTFIEPSLSEKQAFQDASAKLEVAQKSLGTHYCVLVLGLGLETQHHMACGQSRVSSTYKDRSMFEALYSFCSYVVWITFRRKEYEKVRKELGRMLRSDTFNPAIRVKNAPEEPKEQKDQAAEGGEEDKKEIQREKKLTPAEYRRLHPRRPAIKTIINQRSPAIVSILPSPKEESHWLFRTRRPLSPNSLGKVGHETDEGEESQIFGGLHVYDKKTFKVGILGEPLNQFNPVTLSPLGADNEDEENEEEDGEHKQSEDSTDDKPSKPERGLSRQLTAMSQVTTEAFPDD